MIEHIKHIYIKIRKYKLGIATRYYCLLNGLTYNKTWAFYGKPYIIRPSVLHKGRKEAIQIGDNFIARSKFCSNSIGLIQPVMLNASFPGSKIIIGNNVGISGATISSRQLVNIGNNVLIGSGVLITDNDAHPLQAEDRNDNSKVGVKPIVIEDDVFIGARAIILKGVTIGKGAVIGAGSVVSKDIPGFTIAAGNPAKIIGKLPI